MGDDIGNGLAEKTTTALKAPAVRPRRGKLWNFGLALLLVSLAMIVRVAAGVIWAGRNHNEMGGLAATIWILIAALVVVPLLCAGAMMMLASQRNSKRSTALSTQIQMSGGPTSLDAQPQSTADLAGGVLSLLIFWAFPISVPIAYFIWRRTPLRTAANRLAAIGFGLSVAFPIWCVAYWIFVLA